MNIFEGNKPNFYVPYLSPMMVDNEDVRKGNKPITAYGYDSPIILDSNACLELLKRSSIYEDYMTVSKNFEKNDVRVFALFYLNGDVELSVDACNGELYDGDVPLSDEEKATLRETYWDSARAYAADFDRLLLAGNNEMTITAENNRISGEVLVRASGYDDISQNNPWHENFEALNAMYIGAFLELTSVEKQKELLSEMLRVSLVSPTAHSLHVAFTVDEKGEVSRSLVFDKNAYQHATFELPALPNQERFFRDLNRYLEKASATVNNLQKVLQKCGKLDKEKTTVERD